jgi:type VI secretion system protein ImpK
MPVDVSAVRPPHHAPQQDVARRGRLALAFQEILTAVTRLRGGLNVATGDDAFRVMVRQLLATAEQEARQYGYTPDEVRLGFFAVVAFLDESVLNSPQEMFANWSRRPMQEELFGEHMAGETFFRHLRQLLAGPESPDLADLLEVFQICMLLGFKGRYSASQGGELHAFIAHCADKITRIRSREPDLAPPWRPHRDPLPVARDKWTPRLAVSFGVVFLIAAGLFAAYTVSLHSSQSQLRDLAVQLKP